MLINSLFNRYGDSMPTTEASIKQISHDDSMAFKYFGTKLPKGADKITYWRFFKERIELMEKWAKACNTAKALYEKLMLEELTSQGVAVAPSSTDGE